MGKAEKLLKQFQAKSNGDWTTAHIKTLVKAYDLTLRQRGTSHAVITNRRGQHVTIPMHKPIKPPYLKHLLKLIEAHHDV